MIFAELEEYPSVKEILVVLESAFENIEWGDQGTIDMPDAYFWVREGDEKVVVDNFCSKQFQVKCVNPNEPLIKKVIGVLSSAFALCTFSDPELEPHE